MNPSQPALEPGKATLSTEKSLRESIHEWGHRIFGLMETAEPPSVFSKKGFYGSMMDWAMRDEKFKTQLFRFVDVLPTLTRSGDVARHLEEYLGADEVKLAPALRIALKAAGTASWLVGAGMRSQVSAMARQFMLGSDLKEIAATLRGLRERNIAFTLDVLGETVVSETEADEYARRYLDLIDPLAAEIAKWGPPCRSNISSRGEVPALNLSVKLSALYSQIHATDPDTAIARISERLRPILRRAKAAGGFVNFDMESYALKNLTLAVFKSVFAEPEFAAAPACGIALQAYLRDSEADLHDLLAWARARQKRITVRLVKGAYWDYETILAAQRNWPVPVFSQKAQSDANFEKLSVLLLQNEDAVEAAFGTHNVRSIAHVLAQAQRLAVEPRSFEFQMLYGMAEPIKSAVLELGCRLREYCPVGELLPGIAYFVRRLLENTSNEGFLARKFAKGAAADELLTDPAETVEPQPAAPPRSTQTPGFQNEPPTDFTIPAERSRIAAALRELRSKLGRRHALVIGSRQVKTTEWLASLNPANQEEIIGYAAQGTLADADAALTAALDAQGKWGRTPVEERAAILERTAELMRRDKANLCALEILEAGKNWVEADLDVAAASDFCNFYAAVMRQFGQPQRTQRLPGETNHQHWIPRGIGVVIAPWNFPLAILTGMTTAALVPGNAVIIKPSDQTPVVGARLMELLLEAGLPPGVCNLLTGPGSTVGAYLVAHPKVDFIAFTGSKEVGLRIWETAGRTPPGQRNLKKVVCEMGGKNCLIVDSDADLDEAVAGCITSAFGYQGQKCSALSRLVILEDNYEKFLQRFVAAAASLRVGPAEVPGNMIGPVINRESQERILGIIDSARTEAKLAWQGSVPNDPNACYVPPTIFTEVPASSRLFREEVFGPVLAMSKAADFDEALALANDSEFALTGGCYSRSPVNIERARRELVCGNLYINRSITGAIVERQPFGGFKMSGGGTKAGGPQYLQNFMLPRVVTENCLRRGFAPEED